MSYTSGQHEIDVIPSLALQTPAVKGVWAPGLLPVMVRGIAAVVTTATTAADPATISFDKRVNAGSDSGKIAGGVGVLTIPGGTVAGRVVYKHVNVPIDFSQEVVVELTGASVAGVAHIKLLVEEHWENPANALSAVLSA